tara:strand:+ start:471 stop:659 length:189 start_codon:yes stop_codon:yes gene_type:complete
MKNTLRDIITWQMKIRVWSPACQKMQDQVSTDYFHKSKIQLNDQKQPYTWLLVIPFESYSSS